MTRSEQPAAVALTDAQWGLVQAYREEAAALHSGFRLEPNGHIRVDPFDHLPLPHKTRLKWVLKRHQVLLMGFDCEVVIIAASTDPNRIFAHPHNNRPFVSGTSWEPPRMSVRTVAAENLRAAAERVLTRPSASRIAFDLMAPLEAVEAALADCPADAEPAAWVRDRLGRGAA